MPNSPVPAADPGLPKQPLASRDHYLLGHHADAPRPDGADCAGMPDAELLALGRRLAAACADEKAFEAAHPGEWSAETCEAFFKLAGASGAIARQIASCSASTLAGLGAKAQAVLWYQGFDEDFPDDTFGEASDAMLAASIVRDILDITGGSDD